MARAYTDTGSSVVAAVFVAASIALLASQVVSTSRSAIQAADVGLTHARLAAEAEGGVARAAANLQSGEWDLRRAAHTLDGPDTVTVQVEDERGKAPLNTLTQGQARSLFQAAGVDDVELDALTTAFLDWRDPNRARNTSTPAAPPANNQDGGFRAIEDLQKVPGVTAAIYEALRPSVTVSAGDRAYDPAYSTPVALAAMAGEGSPAAIEAKRGPEVEQPALAPSSPSDLWGRPLTIRIAIERSDGSRFRGGWLIELTGKTDQPYIVRGRTD